MCTTLVAYSCAGSLHATLPCSAIAMAQRALREFDAKAMVARLLPEYLGDGARRKGVRARGTRGLPAVRVA